MARRIILRENGLTGSNPPVGYKFLGFYGLTFSYLESNGVVNSIGGTGSGNVGYGNDGSNSNRWLLTNTTGGSNPGVNNFATDNTDPLSLTGIWIHRFDSYSIDQKPWLDEFQLRLSTYSQYGYLQIKELGSNNVIATYNPTYYNFFMPAFPNPGNYAYIALTPISGGGTFTVGQEYSISWVFNGSNATITADNGVAELSPGVFGLGGKLSQATAIDGQGNNFTFGDLGKVTFTASSFISNQVSGLGKFTKSILQYNLFDLIASDGIKTSTISLNADDQTILDGSTDNRLIINDGNNKGLVYFDDYSANFTTYSLVTKGYVDSVSSGTSGTSGTSGDAGTSGTSANAGTSGTSGVSGITNANNGLEIVSGTVYLGGTLSQNTNIYAEQNSLNILNLNRLTITASGYIKEEVFSGDIISTAYNQGNQYEINSGFFGSTQSNIIVSKDYASINAFDGIFDANLTISTYDLSSADGTTDNRMVISDTTLKGLVYADDYSAKFSTYSLISKKYVDDAVSNQTLNDVLVSGNTGSVPILLASGSHNQPSFSFENDTNTGLYNNKPNEVSIVTGGATAVTFDEWGITIGPTASTGVNHIRFNRTNTGFYNGFGGEIEIKSNGLRPLWLSNRKSIFNNGSTFSSPALNFDGDLDTGWFFAGNGQWGFSSNGLTTSVLNSNGIRLPQFTTGLLATDANGQIVVTSSSTGLVSVDNALEIISGTVYLGGTLSQNTTINSENLNFTIQNFDNLTLTGSSVDINLDNGLFVLDSENVDIYSENLLILSTGDIDLSTTDEFSLTVGSGSITTSDQKGLVYTSDYSATFVTHSLVTKKYVDDEIDTLAIVDGLSIILDIDNKIKISPTAAGSGLTFSNGIFDINVDTTGLTISGDIVSLQNTISGDRVFQDSVTIGGNLTVNGTTSYIYTENLVVEDNLITLNATWSSSPILNAGIEVNRGTEDFASLIWNESTDLWSAGLSGSEVSILLNSGTGLSKNGSTVSVNINNGLEIVSNNISLGGTLSQNTTIDSDGFNLTIGNALEMSLTASDFITLNVPESGTSVNQNVIEISSSSNTISSGFKFATWSYVQTESGAIYVSSQNGSALKSQINITNTPQFIGGGDGSNDNFMLIDDGIGNKGLVYTNDYSVNFTTYSLVTKGYVDSQVTSVGATNGLSEISSGVVGLGGTLSQNTTVNASNYGLYFQGNNEIDHFVNDLNSFPDIYGQVNLTSQIYDARIGSLSGNTFSRVAIQNQSVLLECQDDLSNQVAIQVVSTQLSSGDGSIDNRLLVIDDLSNKGIVYAGDYTGNFTTYSLVTKGYVDSVSSGSINATNGLELISNTLYLGGTLSQNTQINSNGYDFTIGNIDYLTLTASIVNFNVENGVYISNNSSNTAKYGSNIQLNGTQSLFNYGQYINVELGSNSGYASYMTVYGPSTAAYTAFYLGIQNGTGNSSWNNHGFKMEMLGQGSYNTGLKSIIKNGSFSNISVWGIAGSQEVYAIGDIAVYGLVSEDASLTSFDSRSGYFLNRSKSTSTNYGIEIQNTSTYSTSNIGLWISNDGAVTNNNAIVVDTGSSIFNESGGDYDFRIEGDADQNLFFVDASTDNIGVGNNAPSYKLHVSGTVSSTTGFNTNGLDGWTGTFSTGDSRIATVTGGIITSVV
jgi:hypothetical protein